jgi:probable rRNA maturation factor
MSVSIILHAPEGTDIPSEADFRQWVNAAAEILPAAFPDSLISVTIAIVDIAESARLNEQFRQKKGPTNILSFHYGDVPGFAKNSLGDLVICKELVISEAQSAEVPVLSHWAHLTVHGILHLLNYDHENDAEAEIMEALEIRILQSQGFKNPYAENPEERIHDR